MSAPEQQPVRPAVLVSARSENAVRDFLARYVKRHLGMKKPQWRIRYRDEYMLTVLSRPLRAGESAAKAYGPYAACFPLIVASLPDEAEGSGRAEALAWLKKSGFNPVVELAIPDTASTGERIDLGAELVNFLNSRCPWHGVPVDEADLPKDDGGRILPETGEGGIFLF
jgi:hypothetical protein